MAAVPQCGDGAALGAAHLLTRSPPRSSDRPCSRWSFSTSAGPRRRWGRATGGWQPGTGAAELRHERPPPSGIGFCRSYGWGPVKGPLRMRKGRDKCWRKSCSGYTNCECGAPLLKRSSSPPRPNYFRGHPCRRRRRHRRRRPGPRHKPPQRPPTPQTSPHRGCSHDFHWMAVSSRAPLVPHPHLRGQHRQRLVRLLRVARPGSSASFRLPPG